MHALKVSNAFYLNRMWNNNRHQHPLQPNLRASLLLIHLHRWVYNIQGYQFLWCIIFWHQESLTHLSIFIITRTLLNANAKQTQTSSPSSLPSTRGPTPAVTCYCCFDSPGFGDYFEVKKGGYTIGSTYGEGDLQCTAAFTVASATTMVLELDICNVNMLVIGGGGGGKSMPCTKYI